MAPSGDVKPKPDVAAGGVRQEERAVTSHKGTRGLDILSSVVALCREAEQRYRERHQKRTKPYHRGCRAAPRLRGTSCLGSTGGKHHLGFHQLQTIRRKVEELYRSGRWCRSGC